jgi:3-oxoacyl-[acyl-carrier-protein] synthase II
MRGQVRQVAVTGMGMVTALGHSLRDTVTALAGNERAGGPTTRFDASGFRQSCSAEVVGLDPRPYFTTPKAIKLTDQAARLGVIAARQAIDDSGFPRDPGSLERLGVLIGSSGADLQPMDLARALAPDPEARSADDIPFFAGKILAGLNPLWLLVNLPNMISAHVAIQLGARGPNSTVMSDSVAGLQAIGEAWAWIRDGEASAVLAGGADTGVLPFAFGAYEQAGAFDQPEQAGSASGFIPGEGAAVLMLEEREHALQRGAMILGEIVTYASTAAAVDDVAVQTGGALTWTMTSALRAAGWAPAEVRRLGVVSLGLPQHNALAHAAIEAVFGPAGEAVFAPVHTAQLGHALGASGAIEAGLLLATEEEGTQILCSALGYSGQAVTLALRTTRDGGGIL